jgi:hypothetical protein
MADSNKAPTAADGNKMSAPKADSNKTTSSSSPQHAAEELDHSWALGGTRFFFGLFGFFRFFLQL